MSPVLGVAVYIIIWWLAFFTMLPFGARSHHEAGEAPPPGSERGAPLAHRLGFKALMAAGIAAIVWLFVAWGVSVDLFSVRR
jgi:predicted secreted protein